MLTWRLVRADSRAQGSRLPLHCAAENQASEGVTKLLLAAYPEAAKATDDVRACLVGVVVAVVLIGLACGALAVGGRARAAGNAAARERLVVCSRGGDTGAP